MTAFSLVVVAHMTMWGTEKHGVAVGAVIGLTYSALLVAAWFPRATLVRWSVRHPALDMLPFPLAVFSGLALFTPLSLVLCVAFAAIGTAVLLGIGWLVRRYRRPSNEPELSPPSD
jgi:hypothetical protein